jgi:hypothetical protein
VADDQSTSKPAEELDIAKLSNAIGEMRNRLNGISKESALIDRYAAAWARQTRETSVNTGQTFSILSKIGGVLSKLNESNALSYDKMKMKAERADLVKAQELPEFKTPENAGMLKDALAFIDSQIEDVDFRLASLGSRASPAMTSLIRTFNRLSDSVNAFKTSLSIDYLRQVYALATRYGQDLIEANSALEHRNELLRTGLRVQIDTGAELEVVAQIQNRLIDRGFDTLKNYEDMVKTATQLHKGLRLSVDSVGRLGSVAQSARVPFTSLGNTIARIVDDTAVVADRATQIANELTRAALGAQGINANNLRSLDQATEVVAQIEGFLKGTVADAEAITGLLGQFTRFSQKGGLGMMLGTGGVDFLSGPQAGDNVRKTLRGLDDFINAVGTTGPALESLESMFGVSRETLVEFSRAVREQGILNRQVTQSQTALMDAEKRYRRQMTDQGEVFATLGRQVKILLADIMTPFVMVLRAVSSGLSLLINEFDGVRKILGPVIGIFGGVVIVEAARRLWNLTSAVVALGVAATKSATAVAMQATTTGQLAGAMSSSRLMRWITIMPNLVMRSLSRLPFGSIVGRMLGGLLRTVAVPLLTRILPLLAGFLPGLILTAIVMLWPYIKKLFTDDRKQVAMKESPSDMARQLAWHIGRTLKEGRMDLTEFQAKVVTFMEARRAELTEEQLQAVISEAVQRASTTIRVVGAQAQLNVVDRAKAEESIRQQNLMIDRMGEVAVILKGLREDYKNALVDDAKKKAAEEERMRAVLAQDAAMGGGMTAVHAAAAAGAYGFR